MPIHTSWKSMAKGMKSTYKSGKTKCRPFTDGKKVCMSQKAWSVFYATIKKMGSSETKPRPKKTKTAESRQKIFEWFVESTLLASDIPSTLIPERIMLARRALKSPEIRPHLKKYWQGQLDKWCKENHMNEFCKGNQK